MTIDVSSNNGGFKSTSTCAYDTVLSLPSGSTKQFVVKVPKDSFLEDETVKVTLLDKNEVGVVQKEFEWLLEEQVKALPLGILSDKYLSLTYLDMGGNEIYYGSNSYPIKLVELDQDNLEDTLDVLSFLVIDSYNTSVLSDKALESIEQWLDNGGVLIIGTGSGAEEVLSGLDNLDIQCFRGDGRREDIPDSYG
ncbi:MAG: hypothetical protein K2M81_06845, partial [Lachnospiraceae bacterium]|nr:hypothetical protein [Lachnospiraceae bacterium]